MKQLTVKDILGNGLASELDSLFTLMSVSEEEIARAQRAWPRAADRIWHSFSLLKPTLTLTYRTEVYALHCRELLARVASGEDTRPGTAVECCAALAEISQRAPLTTAAAGLYARMWDKAGLPPVDLARVHYEALKGDVIDDQERFLRAGVRQGWRSLPEQTEHVPACPFTLAQSQAVAA